MAKLHIRCARIRMAPLPEMVHDFILLGSQDSSTNFPFTEPCSILVLTILKIVSVSQIESCQLVRKLLKPTRRRSYNGIS